MSQMKKSPAPAALTAAAVAAPQARIPRFRHMMRGLRQLHERERSRLRAEIAHVPTFLRLLLKPGTGRALSASERSALRARWRGMGRLGLYLTSMVVPGTTLTLPLLAWWLDRRDERHARKSTVIGNADPSG